MFYSIDMPEDRPFRSLKTSLHSILRLESAQETRTHLEDAVRRTNDIVRHAYQLLKLFLLRHPSHPVDDKLVKFCLQSCYSTKTKHSGRKGQDADEKLKSQIKEFRIREYDPLLAEHQGLPDGSRLAQILKLQEADMVQNLETIPSLHYLNHLWRFLKFTFRVRDFEMSVDETPGLTTQDRKRKKAEKKREIGAIKNDILDVEDALHSDPIYHSWIVEMRSRLRPAKLVSQFSKRSIPYDVKAHPLDYIPCLLFMTSEMEASAARQGIEVRLFHPLPLRASLIPCHITLDTEALNNLIPRNKKKGAIRDLADELWRDRFLTEKKLFRKGSQTDPKYVFRNTISTDGVAATILLVKPHLKGKRMIKTAKAPNEDVYIDDANGLMGLTNRRVVTIDPGKSDLIYCNDGEKRFRYTQNRRRRELKTKKAKQIRESLQTPEVQESTAELSARNTKTCDPSHFVSVVRRNNRHAHRHVEHFAHFMYRKLKLNGYINRQRSESRMLNDFEKAFGSRRDVWIAFGDHEQRGLQMRGIEPTIDTGLRSLFRRNGFELRLIDEHRTSCRCHLCGRPTETYLTIPNPKPWKRHESKLCHGLLRCQSPERTTDATVETCRGRSGWNRDRVATENMLSAVQAQMRGEGRPKHLRRGSLWSATIYQRRTWNPPGWGETKQTAVS